MSGRPRFVFDTNVLISALMFSQSKPRVVWNQARKVAVILASHDTLQELSAVLRRPKLAAYISVSESTTDHRPRRGVPRSARRQVSRAGARWTSRLPADR